jgi:cation:H+ antiporter
VAVAFAALTAVLPFGRPLVAVFVAALAFYLYFAFRQESTANTDHGAAFDKAEAAQEVDPALRPESGATSEGWLTPLAMAVGGLLGVVLGGKLLVDSAVGMARAFGISETVIGLTIVAISTSVAELVTSVMAAVRRQMDVAFGKIFGSNIYNILGIAGVTALVSPTQVPPEIIGVHASIMVLISVVMFVFAWTGFRIGRREGGLLLADYAAYLMMLWPT